MLNITSQIVTPGTGPNPVLPESPPAHNAARTTYGADQTPISPDDAAIIRKITSCVVVIGGAIFLASRLF